MKLLILGGTVFLSKKVAEFAVERGHQVTVVSRGVSGSPPAGVEHVIADRDDPAGLVGLAGRVFDAVVDVARLPGQVKYALETLADTTGNWIFVSSASAYADNATPGQTAQTAPTLEPIAQDSLDPDIEKYGASKVTCENIILSYKPQAMVIRAGLIVGDGDPGYRFGYWPDRIADGGEILAPGSPEDKVQYVDVADLATWVLDSAEKGTAGVFDGICRPLTRAEFFAAISRGAGAEPRLTWVPQDFLIEHDVKPWAGERSLGLWLPLPEYAGFMTRDPGASIEAGLSVRPLADTAADWLATRPQRPAPNSPGTRYQCLTRDEEAEVLAAWHDPGRGHPGTSP